MTLLIQSFSRADIKLNRWCCPVPLGKIFCPCISLPRSNFPAPGIPHCVMTDDVYRDFDIPQNAMIIANIWFDFFHPSWFKAIDWSCDIDPRAMSRAYPQPEEFRPERFMDSSVEVEDPRDAVFGFGRRWGTYTYPTSTYSCSLFSLTRWCSVCPGRHFAEAGIWVATATITATLRLSKALDEHCKPITPNADFTSGFTR